MLDVVDLDKSLKLRALGRLTESNHPYLKLVREKLDFSDYINPVLRCKLDGVANIGIELLREDRLEHIKRESSNLKMLKMLKDSKIKDLLTIQGRNSLLYFGLVVSNKKLLKDINLNEWKMLERFLIDRNLNYVIKRCLALGPQFVIDNNEDKCLYLCKNILKPLHKLTAKEFRVNRARMEPECIFKIGVLMSPSDSYNWLTKLNSLTSTRHKNNILRVIHGEIYSNERKYRFGLVDNPSCDRCGAIDTPEHKLFECPPIEEIWRYFNNVTDRLVTLTPNCDLLHRALGAFRQCPKEVLTLQGEALTRILFFKTIDTAPPPEVFTRNVISSIIKKEKSFDFKRKLEVLLQ
jgi:hypothetical protein